MNTAATNDGAPSPGDAGLVWTDDMLVGNGRIDDSHQEMTKLINALLSCGADNAFECVEELTQHLLSHFEDEERLMRQTGYPSLECHGDEHEQVASAVYGVRQRCIEGRVTIGDVRRLGKALADWLPGHITYMDSALAAWVSKKRFGAAPLILRRDAARGYALALPA